MSISVAHISSQPAVTVIAGTQPAPQVRNTGGQPQPDTVHISEEAQARLLEQDGESPAVIAETLGLSTSTVDDFLDLPGQSYGQSLSTGNIPVTS